MAAVLHICRRYVLNDEEVSKTFDLLDIDKDGRLNRVELAILLRTIKVEPTRMDLDFMFKEMDHEECGTIEKAVFLDYIRCPAINKLTIGELHDEFKRFDQNGTDTFTLDALKRVLHLTAEVDDDDAVEQFFDIADTDQDGLISFDDFIRAIRQD